jgi:hypothetical protein
MLSRWSILSLVVVALLVILIVVSIGALGIMTTEHVDILTAYGRAMRCTFGMTDHGPKHPVFSTIYSPLVYVAMFVVTSALLGEVLQRAK